MPSFDVEFDVECAKCKGRLNATAVGGYSGSKIVEVEPCEQCMDEAKDNGDTEGYDRGLKDGREEAETDGDASSDEQA